MDRGNGPPRVSLDRQDSMGSTVSANKKAKRTASQASIDLNKRLMERDHSFLSLCQVVNKAYPEDFNEVNIATAFNRLGKLKRSFKPLQTGEERGQVPPEVADAVSKLVGLGRREKFPPRETANLCHGIATGRLDLLDTQCLVLMRELIKRKDWREFAPQEISNLIWSFAKVDSFQEELMHHCSLDLRERNLGDFTAQAISVLAWSYGKLEYRDETFFHLLSDELMRRGFKQFDNQHVSNLVWSFGRVEIRRDRVFSALAREVLDYRGMTQFSHQDVGTLACGFAQADELDKTLYEAFSKECRQRGLQDFELGSLANVLFAFARANVMQSEELYLMLEKEILRKDFKPAKPTELAHLVWSLAFICITRQLPVNLVSEKTESVERIFRLTSKECLLRSFKSFSVSEMQELAFAFARMGYKSAELFDSISREITEQSRFNQHVSCDSISGLVWSFGKMKMYDSRFCMAALDEIEKRGGLQVFSPPQITDIINGYSMIRAKHPVLFRLIERAFTEGLPDEGSHVAVGGGGNGSRKSSRVSLAQFHPNDFCLMLVACARLGMHRDDVYRSFCNEINARGLGQFTPRNHFMIEAGLDMVGKFPLLQMSKQELSNSNTLVYRLQADDFIELGDTGVGTPVIVRKFTPGPHNSTNPKSFPRVQDEVCACGVRTEEGEMDWIFDPDDMLLTNPKKIHEVTVLI